MATKLGRNEFPAGMTANDFKCYGPPATKDTEFSGSRIADMGCFQQESTDSNKYYHGAVVQSKKNSNWYVILILGAFGMSIVVYFLTRDIISSISLLVFAILLAVVAARKPRTLQYHLGDHGLQVEQKFYPYQDFKSFSVINEGAINSIMLLPLKRFATGVTMYYAPEDEQKILDVLSSELPYEERQQDPVDKFMQRIRF